MESGHWDAIEEVATPTGKEGTRREGAVPGREGQLCLVRKREFDRLDELELSPELHAEIFSTLCRVNILYMIAKAGSGHIGTCFSSTDIMSWLYLRELRDPGNRDSGDIFFSSKGHDAPALYAILIARGLLDFDEIHRLRRLGGLPGHPHITTPNVWTNTGSLGMGISKGKGMATGNRLLGRDRRVFVLTGDGELQEGQIWESLSTAAHGKLGEMTAIVDHNKVQSDTWVKDVNDVGDLEAKFSAFGWEVARCDGHDFADLGKILGRFREIADRPKVLIADTVKGRGVSFMEAPAMKDGELYGYHSGAPTEEEYDLAVGELVRRVRTLLGDAGAGDVALEWSERPVREKHTGHGNVHRLVNAYEDELVRQAERNERLVVLDADLIKDCGLIAFEERFPERFIECGIAEQDMVSQAGGLARMGLLPVVHSFACFLTTRPNEQIYNNATEGNKIVYAGSLAGLLPGGPGHSHQSVRDISALGSVPGLALIEPCNEPETRMALDHAVNDSSGSTYIRLCSMGWDMPFDLPADYRLEFGKGVTVREPKTGDGGGSGGERSGEEEGPGTVAPDAVVFAYGPWLVSNAWEAAAELEVERGLALRVVNLPWLNRVDDHWLAGIVDGCRVVVALDNHYEIGGQGQLLLSRMAELGLGAERFRHIGLSRIPECGGTQEVLEVHRLDAASLARRFAEEIEA